MASSAEETVDDLSFIIDYLVHALERCIDAPTAGVVRTIAYEALAFASDRQRRHYARMKEIVDADQ